MKLPQHPLHWTSAVRPADAQSVNVCVVPGGARASGGRADALVVLDCNEIARRAEYGLHAVTALPVLDALMNLPWRVPVRTDELGERCSRLLSAAPRGAIEWDGGGIIRLLTPPLTVLAAVVDGSIGRSTLARAQQFAPFAQRVLMLPSPPPRSGMFAWEAEAAGVGIWVGKDVHSAAELVAPQPFVRSYFKPAAWRFAERALHSATSAASGRRESSVGRPVRRPLHTVDEVPGQLRLSS